LGEPEESDLDEAIIRFIGQRSSCSVIAREVADYLNINSQTARKKLEALVKLKKIKKSTIWAPPTKYCSLEGITPEDEIVTFLDQRGGCADVQDFQKYWKLSQPGTNSRLQKLVTEKALKKRMSGITKMYCLPGTGSFDWHSAVGSLKDKGYTSSEVARMLRDRIECKIGTARTWIDKARKSIPLEAQEALVALDKRLSPKAELSWTGDWKAAADSLLNKGYSRRALGKLLCQRIPCNSLTAETTWFGKNRQTPTSIAVRQAIVDLDHELPSLTSDDYLKAIEILIGRGYSRNKLSIIISQETGYGITSARNWVYQTVVLGKIRRPPLKVQQFIINLLDRLPELKRRNLRRRRNPYLPPLGEPEEQRFWTQKEDAILIKNFPTTVISKLKTLLPKKKERAIWNRAKKLKLEKLHPLRKIILPYDEARSIVSQKGFLNAKAYRDAKTFHVKYGLPVHADAHYKRKGAWYSWDHFLGKTGSKAKSLLTRLDFDQIEKEAVHFLEQQDGCATVAEFSDYWGVSDFSSRMRLRHLTQAGVVEKRGGGNNTRYCLPHTPTLTLEEDIIQFLQQRDGCISVPEYISYISSKFSARLLPKVPQRGAYIRQFARMKIRPLIRAGIIERRGTGPRTKYCLPQMPTYEEDVVRFLEQQDGCATRKEFSDHWNLAKAGTKSRLTSLTRVGVVERRGWGPNTKYCLPQVPRDLPQVPRDVEIDPKLSEAAIQFLKEQDGCASTAEFSNYWKVKMHISRKILKALVEAGIIKRRGRGAATKFCLPQTTTFEEDVIQFLQRPEQNGCATAHEFASLGFSLKRLRPLVRAGVIEKRGGGSKVRYCLPQALTFEEDIVLFLEQRGGGATTPEFASYWKLSLEYTRDKLRDLIQAGIIIKQGRSRYLLPPYASLVWYDLPFTEGVIRFLEQKGCATSKEIAFHWKLTQQTVRIKLKPLIKKGIIKRVGKGPTIKYCLPSTEPSYPFAEETIQFLEQSKSGCASKAEFASHWGLTDVRSRLIPLIQAGIIKQRGKGGQNTRYCLTTLEEDVIQFLQDRGGCATAKDFASWMPVKAGAISRILKPLIQAGTIQRRGGSFNTIYCL